MSRILVIGASPLPFENEARRYAANLRTWQFAKPLGDAGHEVRLVGCRLPKTYFESSDLPAVRKTRIGDVDYRSVAQDVFEQPSFLQETAEDFAPEAIVGVTTYASSRAVRVESAVPIWCDLHGWIMAEAQSKASVYDDDAYLSHFWKMERAVLERADVISTVSEPQSYAVIGELAALGRLTKSTYGYRFSYPIPTATHEVEYRIGGRVVRGPIVDDDAFVVLWVGGYNTWTDVDLLFDALVAAMEELPELHFVSTGGAIDGHDEITFERFRERVERCRCRNRFHFVGWIPTESVPSYYAESDLGINIDSPGYEAVFGARTRLNEMMHCGLPVLTTTETEISRQITAANLGLSCAVRDAAGLAQGIVWAARNRSSIDAMAARAKKFVDEELSYARTTRPLLDWASRPMRAPDMGHRVEFEDIDFFGSRPERALDDSLETLWAKLKRLLAASRGRE